MKKLIFFLSIQFLVVGANAQNTITTNNLTQTSFCAGGNIIVQYTSTGTFPIGCTFSAELSDNQGNFNSPVVIGSMPLNTGLIAGTIPSNTTFGFNYRVRVVASDPYTVGSSSTTPIIITSTAVTATIVARPSTEICHGDSISLWVTYNSSYHWSTGGTSQTIHVRESGTYNVTVTNYLTGCEVTSDPISITVHPTPQVHLGPDASMCDGQILRLNAGAGFSNYLWNDSSNAQIKNVHSAGTYSVFVTDSFGCKGGDTILVVYHPNPVVNLGRDTNLCGSTILLSAGQGFSAYNWNNGLSLNPTFLAEVTGTYFVSVTDINGCSARDTIRVLIHSIPVINLGNDISACGTSVQLDAGAGFSSYNWNNGFNRNRMANVSISGVYFVKVTDRFGCYNFDTVHVIIHPLPEITVNHDFRLPQNNTLVLDAGPGFSSYHWNTGQNSESILLNGSDFPLGQVSFTVMVTDSFGCTNSQQALVSIVPAVDADGLSVFPNPFHDVLFVKSGQDLSAAQPVLYDALGRIYHPIYSFSNSVLIIRRIGIPDGVYSLTFNGLEGILFVRKVIIY